MKFIKYIFSLFVICFGINSVFATTDYNVFLLTKKGNIDSPDQKCKLSKDDFGVKSVTYIEFNDYEEFLKNHNKITSNVNENKIIIVVFDRSLEKKIGMQIGNIKKIFKLIGKNGIVVNFGDAINDDKIKKSHRYIPNLSDDIREIKDYIHRKANGLSGSTSESRISSVDSSSELSSEDNECSSRLSNLTTTNTPSKVIFAGAGVQRPETTQHHKSKIRRSENSNIKKAQKLDFDELAENEKAEEAKKAEEEAKEVAISVQPEKQTDEKIKPVQNDRNGMILPSEESQDVSIDVSTRVIDEKTKLIENKDSEDEEEKNTKKSTCGCTIL